MAQELAAEVQAKALHIDSGILQCGGNHRYVWRQIAHCGAEWSVCLEDDAKPVDGFLEQLDQVLTIAPAPVVSLYLGRKRPSQFMGQIELAVKEAEAIDANWIMSNRIYQAVGLAIRTDLVGNMLEFARRKTFFQIDDCIGYWAIRNQHAVAHTWPSIVEHRDVRSVEHRKREPGRVAWKVGTRDKWTRESCVLG